MNWCLLASIVWSVINTVVADSAMTHWVRDSTNTTAATSTSIYNRYTHSDSIAANGGDGTNIVGAGMHRPAVLLYSNAAGVPSLFEGCWMFLSPLVLLMLHDSWFFLVHSTLHRSKFLYATIHAWHHEKNAPSACDVFYMHPAESFVAVVLPFLIIPRFLPLHWFIWEGMLAKGIMIDVYGQ